MRHIIIFTDLDGTLLDSAYSFHDALPALEFIREHAVPLVICSSKTRAEIEHYRKKLDNRHPFISENGGGIFIPKGYFDPGLIAFAGSVSEDEDYHIIGLGARYSDLRRALRQLKNKGFYIRGFGDMSVEELADVTGLSPDEAKMAQRRDFDEPFLFDGDESASRELFSGIKRMGFNFTQGSFYHILGDSDKGRAVSILIGLYRKIYSAVGSIAIGDSPNDFPMLEAADVAVLVQRTDGKHAAGHNIPNIILQEGIGPVGWGRAVLKILTAGT
ncbi:MAG: HAD-IIB family hydrolase [Syntrophorhabdaceae bacterium]|nr:HAD-IIB family hydrolase [Syntrophorhabdaceae bacterium]MDD5245244.1 HAD-IIB family hydrolase [Syntrophorhabdaceae bacterium]